MTVFDLTNATVLRGARPAFENLNWTFREGESWAVVGPTGSGKTTLAETLLGKHIVRGGELKWPLFERLRAAGRAVDYPSQVVAHVSFKEDSRLFSYAGRYYQQRFEFADSASDDPLTLDAFLKTGTHATAAERAAVCARFGLSELLHQWFMTLSNGQTRRARLARALLAKPELLVLDDPFIGLDAAARADLNGHLGDLARGGARAVLICREDAVPAWATHRLELRGPERWERSEGTEPTAVPSSELRVPRSEAVIQLRNVTVRHAGHTILDSVSWTARAGERWAVLGPNGSGKSTLLSLLCGDHPQAYSNDVRLFGRRRGSGETIWDVKRNVGLLSPELHLYFNEPLTAERAAATGFFDGLADQPTTPEQAARVRELFAALGISHLVGRAFRQLSTGEQRLVLFVRALVKRPPLLILDEPFQGMDTTLVARCREWLARELTPEQTLLFVTHDPAELPAGVARTLRLDKGRVISG